MSKTGALWLETYENIIDDYRHDLSAHGEDSAREAAVQKLKSLGLLPAEINDQLSELTS